MRTSFALAALTASASATLPTLKESVQFIGGFLDKFAIDNSLTELETCTTDAQSEVELAFQTIAELEAGQKIKAAADIAKFQQNLSTVLSACTSMQDDILRLKAWSAIFKDQTELVSTITKHVLLHPTRVANDVKAAQTDVAANNWNAAGADFADLVELGLGPVPSMMEEIMPMFDLMSVPEFLGGFLEGMVGESHLTEIEACYSGATPMVHYAQSFIEELLHLQIIKALESFEAFVYHFQVDLAPCTQMQGDLKTIEDWAAQFKNPAALIPTITKHVLFHKSKIQADWTAEKNDWASGNYFQAGKEMADLVVLAVGPIAEPTAFLQ